MPALHDLPLCSTCTHKYNEFNLFLQVADAFRLNRFAIYLGDLYGQRWQFIVGLDDFFGFTFPLTLFLAFAILITRFSKDT